MTLRIKQLIHAPGFVLGLDNQDRVWYYSYTNGWQLTEISEPEYSWEPRSEDEKSKLGELLEVMRKKGLGTPGGELR